MEKLLIRRRIFAGVICITLLILMIGVAIFSSKREDTQEDEVASADAIMLLNYISEQNFEDELTGDYITVAQGRSVYSKLCKNMGDFPVKGKADKRKLTRQEWIDIYMECAKAQGMSELISTEEYTVMGTLEGAYNQVYTDRGIVFYENINIQRVRFQRGIYLMFGENIIYQIAEKKEETKIQNIYIEKASKDAIELMTSEGRVNLTGLDLEQNPELISENVADITVYEGGIKEIVVKNDLIHGKIMSVKEKEIEIQGYGVLPIQENFSIYKTYGELEGGNKKDLVVGYDVAEFAMENGKICAALVRKTPDMQNIRVLIKTSGFSDLFHEHITMEFTAETKVIYPDSEKVYQAGDTVEFKPGDSCFAGKRVYVEPKDSTGRTILTSVERDGGQTGYRGTFEIYKVDGKLCLINELLLEEYLYDVVPSEMPASYDFEALKVQAVCARSYAYNEILYNGYAQYGAHVDDSVSYQVYHNVSPTEDTINAVKETCGEVAKYGDSVIDAYYYSTSCGVTTDADIWGCGEEKPYIASHTVDAENESLDLTSEDSFSQFIHNKSRNSYDGDVNWYRWRTRVSLKQLKRNIDQNMMERYQANPQNILTKNKDGVYESVPVDTVGTVKSINITKRGKGGIATEMIIKGSKNTVKVLTEYNIRVFLAPVNSVLTRNDGSTVNSLSLLPSAYTTALPVVDEEDSKTVVAYEMYGGGYGHGAGMSQNGANTMAKEGKSYEEILQFFYQGIVLEKLYE